MHMTCLFRWLACAVSISTILEACGLGKSRPRIGLAMSRGRSRVPASLWRWQALEDKRKWCGGSFASRFHISQSTVDRSEINFRVSIVYFSKYSPLTLGDGSSVELHRDTAHAKWDRLYDQNKELSLQPAGVQGTATAECHRRCTGSQERVTRNSTEI
jgi:hypothetical protein